MRSRRTAALVAAATIFFAGAPAAAWATDPVTLGSGFVADDVGALSSSDASAVEDRLERLSSETDVDLWVVYVDEFTGAADSEEWANDTADLNGLGPNQYLLAIAVDARQYYLSGDSAGPLTEDQLIAIEQQRVQPELRSENWAGAAIAAADGLEAAVGGGTGGTTDGGATDGGATATSGPGYGTILIGVIVVAGIGVAIWLIVRSRRKKGDQGTRTPPVEQIDTAELVRRAASALVDTDDALRTSEQELGFARAQFGDAAAAEFEQTLAAAKENLNRAFTLKQQLDDETPDTDEQTRAWNVEILRLCEESNAALDAKAAAFDELRKLEQNAPEALARVQADRTRAAEALAAATAELQTLTTSYAPEALATVADNPEQARQRIAFADERLAAAQAAIGAGNGGEAAASIRAAEEAVGQAALLEKAIGTLQTDLAAAEQSAGALVAELERDVAGAATLPDPDGRIAAVIASTRQQIDTARAQLSGSARRPLLALQGLESANQQIDTLVQGVRDAAAQQERARQMVGQLILQAQAQVSAAEDYITARRGAIGAEARTRLAEAGAALVQAQQLQQQAPEQATQYAQRANQLAAQAIQSAQRDVGSFGGGTGGGGDNMLGAVLGGIVINSLLGGGGGGRRSSGGMGGGFGGMLGGGGGGRSGGGMRPGSFGGGGTRSRRGGGRF